MPLIPRNFGHYPIQFTSPPSNGYHHGYANYGYQGMGLSQRQYNYQMTSPQFARPYQKNSGYQYGYGPYYGGGTQNMIQPYKKPGIGAQFLMLLNGIEQQLQYESYMRNLRAYENNQRKFYRRQQQYFPPTIHRPSHPPIIPPPLYTNNNRSIVAEYEREIRYEPFPIFITKPNLHSGHNIGGPKYIFVPISYPPFQSSMGPLSMPPFLFDRMVQPLCSLPLPPPLPPISNLPLSPMVQQMVMQRYSNPVAVYPFASMMQNPYLMSNQQQMVMPPYHSNQFNRGFIPPPPQPMIAQQACMMNPQQYMLPRIPIIPMAPAQQQQQIASTPCLAAPQQQQQQQIMLPISQPQQFASSSISQPMFFQQQMAASTVQSQQLVSNTLAQPILPALLPQQQVMMQPQSQIVSNSLVQPAYSQQQPISCLLQPPYGNSNMCRACVPMPPSLSIPVTGNCWIQHCSCCYYVPSEIGNERRSGRVTPLLRQSTVSPFLPNTYQHQQQSEPPVLVRPWLRKTPPLPPGAILLSDEFVDNPKSQRKYRVGSWDLQQWSQKAGKDKGSATSNGSIDPVTASGRNNQEQAPSIQRTIVKNIIFKHKIQEPSELSNASATAAISSDSTEYKNTEFFPTRHRSTTVHYQNSNISAPRSIRYHSRSKSRKHVNKDVFYTSTSMKPSTLHFNYYPPAVQSVVHTSNKYSKSSSEDSSQIQRASRNYNRHFISTKHLDNNSMTLDSLDSEEEKSVPLMINDMPKKKIIVIREYINGSPSTISTASSNSLFSIVDTNLAENGRLSTTSAVSEEAEHNSDSF